MADLAGTWQVLRHILHRDRWVLPLWLLGTWTLATSRALSIATVYPDEAARRLRYDAVMSDVPMFKLFQGPAYGDSAAALVAQESVAGGTLLAALWACLLVVRHTRAEEQAGRTELARAGVVGRHAHLAAALTEVLGAAVLLAVLVAATMAAAGLPVTGSVVFGLVLGAAAAIGAGLAAVAAQVTANPRLAAWGAFLLFFALHFVRGIGDLAGGSAARAVWAVPNAWLQRTRPFADERWWPFGLVLVLVVVLVVVAFRLSARRDLAAAVVAPRPGPDGAEEWVRGPIAMAWRQHRTALLVWVAALSAVTIPSGFGGTAAMESYATSDLMAEWAAAMGTGDPADAFFAYIVFTMVFPVTIYAMATALRVVGEERSGLAETVLARPTTRLAWAGGHLLVAASVPVVLELVIGLGFGIGSGQLGTMLRTTMVLVPAVWVMVGVAVAAFGLVPRLAAVLPWLVFAVALTGELGQHLGWPRWTFLVTSPFSHVMPFYGPPSAGTVLALMLLAAGLTAAGLVGLRRRDLVTS
ncbi:ABC transporter permease [Myceligenerans pegani]|uniref:Antibiotic ABC transporter n=1 Tax=Myceligenerans pegani TaxID=2776917 RepID=A0ABR9MW87_9MICO|nr:antibiotic ABC transporter [Myceligenerans sp. TRM 65318]MBE1875654.1 antibiotic ABC transporter [Myceligenerans sp. TRM 65318]MBE3017925.1 antibiotic ABC transporter [Myceligenerans sp. TRM 65318]